MLYFQNLNLSFSLFLFSGILVAVFRYAVHVAVVMFSTLHAYLTHIWIVLCIQLNSKIPLIHLYVQY